MLQKDNRYKILEIFFNNPIPEGIGFYLREISRISGISLPSTKKYLLELEKEGIIVKNKHRVHNYPIYLANRDNEYFLFLKKIDNLKKLKESGLLDYLNNSIFPEAIILFGSYSKGEDIIKSDIDLLVIGTEKKLNLENYEQKLNRKINLLFCKSFGKLSKELKNNLINGIVLEGYLQVFK